MRRVCLPLVLVAMASCNRTSSPSPEPPIRADDAAVAAASTPATPATPAPTPTETAAPSSSAGSTWCTKDADCAWDDPCMAKRCIAAPKTPFVGCDKSYPPPGTCVCLESECTMKRSGPAPKVAGCKVDGDCGFDAGGGACKPGLTSRRIRDQGAICRCDSGSCALEWVDLVECKTTADCSWLESPRRPAPASKVPRPKPPVKPCSTGEWDSVCSGGICRITAWKC